MEAKYNTASREPNMFSANFDPLGIGAAADQYLLDRLQLEKTVDVQMPWQYGPKSDGRSGPAVDSPLTIHVAIELGEYEDHAVIFDCDLEAIVEDATEWMGDIPRLMEMEAALRRLADNVAKAMEARQDPQELGAKHESAARQGLPETPEDSTNARS